MGGRREIDRQTVSSKRMGLCGLAALIAYMEERGREREGGRGRDRQTDSL